MTVRKATLIQDIREYLYILRSALLPLLQDFHAFAGVTVDDALLWIINEEIERTRQLYPIDHRRSQHTYATLYQAVKDALPFPISIYTGFYIQTPRLYGDAVEIRTRIFCGDLYIYYTAPKQKPTFKE